MNDGERIEKEEFNLSIFDLKEWNKGENEYLYVHPRGSRWEIKLIDKQLKCKRTGCITWERVITLLGDISTARFKKTGFKKTLKYYRHWYVFNGSILSNIETSTDWKDIQWAKNENYILIDTEIMKEFPL